MVAGIVGVALAAPHVGVNGSPWPIVPGLVVAGAGLALLVIPLVNVVLAAVPAEVAGGASGLFSTAQQLGGALGVALLGTVFFGYLNGHSFEAALVHTAPYAMGAFALCGVLSHAAAAHGGVGGGADRFLSPSGQAGRWSGDRRPASFQAERTAFSLFEL